MILCLQLMSSHSTVSDPKHQHRRGAGRRGGWCILLPNISPVRYSHQLHIDEMIEAAVCALLQLHLYVTGHVPQYITLKVVPLCSSVCIRHKLLIELSIIYFHVFTIYIFVATKVGCELGGVFRCSFYDMNMHTTPWIYDIFVLCFLKNMLKKFSSEHRNEPF